MNSLIAIAFGSLLFISFGIDKWRARKKSPVFYREPQSLETLSREFCDCEGLSNEQKIIALQVLKTYLGSDVHKFQPTDRFHVELLYLEEPGFDGNLSYMWSDLAEKFGLSQRQLNQAVAQTQSISDFLRLYSLLSSQKIGSIDLSGLPRTDR